MEETVPLVLKIFFGFFLTLGYTFTAGMTAVVPMQEKKGGLRHMMYLLGLNSFQYFFGMAIADFIICLIPNVIACLILLCFDEIMPRESVWEFFVVFAFFGATMNKFSYLFSHLFDDPETGIKYISLLYSLGLFVGPIVVTSIFAALFGTVGEMDTSFQNGFSFWYFFSPLITFATVT